MLWSLRRMTSARVEILPNVWLDGRLGVFFENTRSLAVADLHWGYSVSHRASGNLLPVWGDEEIERRLSALIADYSPDEVLWVGDSVHDLAGCEAAERFIAGSSVPIVVLSGNHDRCWPAANTASVMRENYLFHHGHDDTEIAGEQIEVIGHHHPAFTWRDGAGGKVKLPALVAGPKRLILPAFSPWAAGVPWNRELLPGETLWAIAKHRIFAFNYELLTSRTTPTR